MTKEALELFMYNIEDGKEDVPNSSAPETIQVCEGSFVVSIIAWIPMVRDEMANKAVKKTLTIPKWLNDVAEENKINYSQVLQVALKEKLNIRK